MDEITGVIYPEMLLAIKEGLAQAMANHLR
jgi:hypothetical protein